MTTTSYFNVYIYKQKNEPAGDGPHPDRRMVRLLPETSHLRRVSWRSSLTDLLKAWMNKNSSLPRSVLFYRAEWRLHSGENYTACSVNISDMKQWSRQFKVPQQCSTASCCVYHDYPESYLLIHVLISSCISLVCYGWHGNTGKMFSIRGCSYKFKDYVKSLLLTFTH